MPRKGQFKKNPAKRTLESREYNSRKAQKDKRVANTKARRKAEKEGRVRKGDGKDIDHVKPMSKGGSKSTKNTRIRSRSANRSEGGKMGSRAKKAAGGRKSGRVRRRK